MGFPDYIIFAFGVGLQSLLLWRCMKTGLWRRYPLFFGYFLYTVVETTAQFVVFHVWYRWYAWVYWLSDLMAVFLKFAVGWEVFRHTFPCGSALREIAGRVLVLFLVLLAAAFYFGSGRPGSLMIPDMERKAGLAVAAWFVIVLAMARYYRVPFGRNIWGITVGIGTYLSISVVLWAAYSPSGPFLRFWHFAWPVSFGIMLAIWTWAMWSYAPNPPLPALAAGDQDRRRVVVRWNQAWDGVGAAIRKAVGL